MNRAAGDRQPTQIYSGAKAQGRRKYKGRALQRWCRTCTKGRNTEIKREDAEQYCANKRRLEDDAAARDCRRQA